jgi:hypothetical protein
MLSFGLFELRIAAQLADNVKMRTVCRPAVFLIVFLSVIGVTYAQNIDIGIRFFDKRVFYLGNAPVYVNVSITNNTPEVYRFRLSDDRSFSVDFEVLSLSARPVPFADTLVRKRSGSRQIFFREIAIEPGETFSFIEDLQNYADFEAAGSYIVQAKLYPDMLRSASLVSNRLNLNIRPLAVTGADGLPVALDTETNANLVRAKLPPDEVVGYTLTARQKAQWEKFFLYLDLEAMLSRDAARQRQWRAESEEGRLRMVARYRGELQSAVIDGDISAVPAEFTIERTTYNAEEGTVVVLEKFKVGGYTERKSYTYYLRLKDDVWTIVDYNVQNLGID